MTLVDTSAWMELLNAPGRVADRHLHQLFAAERGLGTTPPVFTGILRGVRDDRRHAFLAKVLMELPRVPATAAAFHRVAHLYRTLRTCGVTIRDAAAPLRPPARPPPARRTTPGAVL